MSTGSKNEIMVNKGNNIVNTGQFTEKDVKDIVDTVNGGFYNVGTMKNPKRVPDSKLVSSLGNAKKINTEPVKIVKNADYVEVHMKATAPNGQYRVGAVTHYYADIMQSKLMSMLNQDEEAYKKFKSLKINEGKTWDRGYYVDLENPFLLDSTGNMTPNLTLKGQKKIVNDMVNFKKISERDAQTKAERVAILKLLNQEWREDEEVLAELDEVKSVNNGKKVTYEEVGETKDKQNENIDKSKNKTKESKTEEPPITDVTPPITELEIEQEQKIRENETGNKAIDRLIEKKETINQDNLVDEVRNMLGEKVITPAEAGKAQKVIANA